MRFAHPSLCSTLDASVELWPSGTAPHPPFAKAKGTFSREREKGAHERSPFIGPAPYATLSAKRASAPAIADGVPTCIQKPSSRSPKRRPSAAACR